ncbi:MAG: ArsA family ATPase [Caldiserica bacterium]|nr:ArsA family ATPase [Caldisericota bacterium]
MQTFFFLGKGGVGKTTLSAAFASGISNEGKRTLVVSLDPAHNLGDVFAEEIPWKIKHLSKTLDAIEVDVDRMILEYLNELSSKLKHTYRYLSVMNLEKYFDVLKNSPGIEEYATLEGIKKFVFEECYDTVIFDTPPTGITVRVLAMPKISLIWTANLVSMRRKILSRRKMIENVRGKFEAEIEGEVLELTSEERNDPIMQELLIYKKETKALSELFSSDKTFVNIVTMAEDLAYFETKRIHESLTKFKINLRKIYLNKFFRIENPPPEIAGKIKEQERVTEMMKDHFKDIEIREVPMLRESPRGIPQLLDLYEKFIQ